MGDFPGQGDTAQLDRPAANRQAEAETVAKAAIRAAEVLDIAPATLAKILGLSKAGYARLADGTFELAPFGAPLVRATLFVSAFVALDTITAATRRRRRRSRGCARSISRCATHRWR